MRCALGSDRRPFIYPISDMCTEPVGDQPTPAGFRFRRILIRWLIRTLWGMLPAVDARGETTWGIYYFQLRKSTLNQGSEMFCYAVAFVYVMAIEKEM